jgi:hypothetical protein
MAQTISIIFRENVSSVDKNQAIEQISEAGASDIEMVSADPEERICIAKYKGEKPIAAIIAAIESFPAIEKAHVPASRWSMSASPTINV